MLDIGHLSKETVFALKEIREQWGRHYLIKYKRLMSILISEELEGPILNAPKLYAFTQPQCFRSS